MSLAERVRERLDATGLNPFSAAKKAGLGNDYVRDILRGRVRDPGSTRLSALAKALDCDPMELIGAKYEAAQESPLATRINERLAHLGKTARGASIEAGLSPDAIRMILNGRSQSPRGDNLSAIARCLECDVRYLLGEVDDAPMDREASTSSVVKREPAFRDTQIAVRSGGHVTLDIKAEVSVGAAAQILALIEGDKP